MQRSHSWGRGHVEGTRTEEEGKFWTKGDLSWLAGRKILKEESVNAREVVGVLLGILRDEVHKITEALLWGTIPSWQELRISPPVRTWPLIAPWTSEVRAPCLPSLRKMAHGPLSFYGAQNDRPCCVVCEATQACGLLKRILWVYGLCSYKYRFPPQNLYKIAVVSSFIVIKEIWIFSLGFI